MKDTDRKEAGRLLKRDKILLGITIGVAALDAGLAYGTYLKKKGVVIRDMVLTSIDDRIHRKPQDENDSAKVTKIPIS